MVEPKREEAVGERTEFGRRRCWIGCGTRDVVSSDTSPGDISGFERSAIAEHCATDSGSDVRAGCLSYFSLRCAGQFSGHFSRQLSQHNRASCEWAKQHTSASR